MIKCNAKVNIIHRTTAENGEGGFNKVDTILFSVLAYVSTVNNLEAIQESSVRVDDVRSISVPIPSFASKQILITDVVTIDGQEFEIAAEPRRYDSLCTLTVRRKV